MSREIGTQYNLDGKNQRRRRFMTGVTVSCEVIRVSHGPGNAV
jgi:hypothetical protein